MKYKEIKNRMGKGFKIIGKKIEPFRKSMTKYSKSLGNDDYQWGPDFKETRNIKKKKSSYNYGQELSFDTGGL